MNGDARYARQVFLNLAINACQAMTSGGSLRLVAAPSSRGRAKCGWRTRGSAHRAGAPVRIFDLYFTTKERGTGIGLSMVYRIIQMHDGEIEVQSTPGRGTTFRGLLPRGHKDIEMPRKLLPLACFVLTSAVFAAGCGSKRAASVPDGPPLAMSEPPRVFAPIEEEPVASTPVAQETPTPAPDRFRKTCPPARRSTPAESERPEQPPQQTTPVPTPEAPRELRAASAD